MDSVTVILPSSYFHHRISYLVYGISAGIWYLEAGSKSFSLRGMGGIIP
jgi:hypothetical protein